MSFTDGISLIQQVFGLTGFSGTLLVMQTIILIGTLVYMTRDVNNWKIMALPVIVGYHLSGLISFNFVFYLISGVIFVIESLSRSEFGRVIGAIDNTIGLTDARRREELRLKSKIKKIKKEDKMAKLRVEANPTLFKEALREKVRRYNAEQKSKSGWIQSDKFAEKIVEEVNRDEQRASGISPKRTTHPVNNNLLDRDGSMFNKNTKIKGKDEDDNYQTRGNWG